MNPVRGNINTVKILSPLVDEFRTLDWANIGLNIKMMAF